MADGKFNIAKGRVVQLVKDTPAKFGVLLLMTTEADAVLEDYDDIAALIAAVGNERADFTNYADKTGVTATEVVDDANDWNDVSMPNQTWTDAGGAANNTLAKAIMFCDLNAGADADLMPISHHDYTPTTNGNSLLLQVVAPGFYRLD